MLLRRNAACAMGNFELGIFRENMCSTSAHVRTLNKQQQTHPPRKKAHADTAAVSRHCFLSLTPPGSNWQAAALPGEGDGYHVKADIHIGLNAMQAMVRNERSNN